MNTSADLSTERLVLHPVTLVEAERIHAKTPLPTDRWAADYPFDGDVAAIGSGLHGNKFSGAPARWAYYQIRRRDDGLAIGGIGFFGPPDENGHVEIGYGLAAGARGSGFAAEALTCMAAWALNHGASAVDAETTPDNVASQRTLGNAGFALVAEDRTVLRYSLRGVSAGPITGG